MNQYSSLWFTYRATAEKLKHEKALFLEKAGHYKELDDVEILNLLAERVEETVSTENAKWVGKNSNISHMSRYGENNG